MNIVREKIERVALDDSWTIAHCIATDGENVTRPFRQQQPLQTANIKQLSDDHELLLGRVLALAPNGNEPATFYPIIKRSSYKRAVLADFNQAMTQLEKTCAKIGIKKLALFNIHNGMDQLDLNIIEKCLKNIFYDLDIEIKLCL